MWTARTRSDWADTQADLSRGVIKLLSPAHKTKMHFVLKPSDAVFILVVNVKMPTIVGILTFMNRINFMFS